MNTAELLKFAAADLACYGLAQSPGFELAPHHRLIVDMLEAVERGEIQRSMMFLPPRHGKSFIGTELFSAWYLGRHPERAIISASYGQELADYFGRKVRNMVRDPIHGAIFPQCRLADDSSSLRSFSTTAGGSYFAVGRGGPITGRGAHLLLIDDPLKNAEEARSEVTRRALHDWYASVAYTRLQPGASIVLTTTRWHEDDLAGHLLRECRGEGWQVLSLPAHRRDRREFSSRRGSAMATEIPAQCAGEDPSRNRWRCLGLVVPATSRCRGGNDFQERVVAFVPRAASVQTYRPILGHGVQGRRRERLFGLHHLGCDEQRILFALVLAWPGRISRIKKAHALVGGTMEAEPDFGGR